MQAAGLIGKGRLALSGTIWGLPTRFAVALAVVDPAVSPQLAFDVEAPLAPATGNRVGTGEMPLAACEAGRNRSGDGLCRGAIATGKWAAKGNLYPVLKAGTVWPALAQRVTGFASSVLMRSAWALRRQSALVNW